MPEFIFKSRSSNVAGDKIYRDCVLLTEGSYQDSTSMRVHFYDGSVLKKCATNWKSNYLNINHSQHPLDRIGYVENQRWNGKSILADLRILPITSRAKDIINLIDNGLVENLSIEAEIDREFDKRINMMKVTNIEFLGCAIVTDPACKDAVIKVR